MYTAKIILNSVENVKNFVDMLNKYKCEVNLVAKYQTINAKSIMSIFSLDLSKPIELQIKDELPSGIEDDISKYLYK